MGEHGSGLAWDLRSSNWSSPIKHSSAAIKVKQFQEFSIPEGGLYLYSLTCRIPNACINFTGEFKRREHQADLSYVVCCAVPQCCPGKRMLFHFPFCCLAYPHSLLSAGWADYGSHEPGLGCQSLLLTVLEPGSWAPVCIAWDCCCSCRLILVSHRSQQQMFLRSYFKSQLFRRLRLQMNS